MKSAILFGSIVAAALVLTVSSAPAGGKKRSDSVVKINAKLDKAPAGKAVVVLKLDIEPGWHLYANPVGHEDYVDEQVVVTVAGSKAVIEYPPGKVIDEQNAGKIKIYRDKIEIRATIDRAAGDNSPIQLSIALQACSDKKPLICLPPANVKVKLP